MRSTNGERCCAACSRSLERSTASRSGSATLGGKKPSGNWSADQFDGKTSGLSSKTISGGTDLQIRVRFATAQRIESFVRVGKVSPSILRGVRALSNSCT